MSDHTSVSVSENSPLQGKTSAKVQRLYRLSNLRKDRSMSQKQLADELHVTHSQISRIESGETKNPNISIVIDAARFFHVSTDYLLGITQITTPKSYDISELGLSEEAVKKLITERIDIDILNCLLEHDHFPRLCIMIRNFFDDTIAEGVMARNQEPTKQTLKKSRISLYPYCVI